MLTLYLVRHGLVHNPTGIIYGRLPNFGLSDVGRAQIQRAAARLADLPPADALFASPLQRAQESATILSSHLRLPVRTDERLLETDIGTFQGRRFEDLPRPYITEEKTHDQLESASSMRARLLDFAADPSHPRRLIAVSHRDPLVVALLHWQNRSLADLPTFPLDTGAVYEVTLHPPHPPQIRRRE